MAIKAAKMLATCVLTEEDVLGNRCKLITVGSRATNQVPYVYGTKSLPVLQSSHPSVQAVYQEGHKKGHEGMVTTLHRCRREVWTIGG
jgi:hypothetical protein